MRPFQKKTYPVSVVVVQLSRCGSQNWLQVSSSQKMLLSFQCKIHIMIPIILVIYDLAGSFFKRAACSRRNSRG